MRGPAAPTRPASRGGCCRGRRFESAGPLSPAAARERRFPAAAAGARGVGLRSRREDEGARSRAGCPCGSPCEVSAPRGNFSMSRAAPGAAARGTAGIPSLGSPLIGVQRSHGALGRALCLRSSDREKNPELRLARPGRGVSAV